MEVISPHRLLYFDMVTKLARAIVNRASQLWETIVLMHQWVLHCAVASQRSYIEGGTGNDSDSDDVVIMAHTIPSEGSATLRIYRDTDNTLGMLGAMSVKLPMPTQFDGRNAHFRERSVQTTWRNQPSQWKQLTSAFYKMPMQEDTQFRDNRYPIVPTEDEADELEDNKELTMSRERYEIPSTFQKTLNPVLVDATKPGSEPHSMIQRIMRTANGFEAWRQLNLPYNAGGNRQYFNSSYLLVEEDNTVGGVDDQSPPKKRPCKPWWHNCWPKGKGKDKGQCRPTRTFCNTMLAQQQVINSQQKPTVISTTTTTSTITIQQHGRSKGKWGQGKTTT
eukprot:4472265-Amphidinium_carterae.1